MEEPTFKEQLRKEWPIFIILAILAIAFLAGVVGAVVVSF